MEHLMLWIESANRVYALQLGVESVEGLRISVTTVTNMLTNGGATQFHDNAVIEVVTDPGIVGSISHMNVAGWDLVSKGVALLSRSN